MRILIANLLVRWHEYQGRKAERQRGADNVIARLAALLGEK